MSIEWTKEQLELVAKAAGMEIGFDAYGTPYIVGVGDEWLPCSDPGDSRRLQVALGIGLMRSRGNGGWLANHSVLFTCNFELFADHPTPDDAACVAVWRCALAVAGEGEY